MAAGEAGPRSNGLSSQPSDSEKRVALGVLVLLVLQAVAPLCGARWAWGIDALRYLGPTWRVGLGLLAIASGLLAARLLSGSGWRALAISCDHGASNLSSAALVILGVGLLLAGGLFLRPVNALLGDGLTYLEQLPLSAASGMRQVEREPLAFAAVRGLHALLGGGPAKAKAAYVLLSVLSGCAFVVIAIALARALTSGRSTLALLFLVLLLQGYCQLFVGYIETYPLVVVAVSGYLLAGTHAAQGRGPGVAAAVALGIGLSLHFSLIALLPSLCLAACDAAPRDGRSWRGGASALGRTFGLPLLALAVALLLLVLSGVDVRALMRSASTRHFLPLLGPGDRWRPYGLLSVQHLVDYANQYLLVSAGALLLLIGYARRPGRQRDLRFLAAAALVPVGLFFLINPEIGAFRDWDLLAWPAIPLTVLACALAARGEEAGRRRSQALVSVIAVSAFSAVAWLSVNASAQASEARFARLLSDCKLATHARAYGWETLGTHLRQTGRQWEASQAYEEAIRADAGNPRYWSLAGLRHAELGDTTRAIAYLRQAIAAAPDSHAENYFNLGTLLLNTGQVDSAIVLLEGALQHKPEFDGAAKNLIIAYGRRGRFGEALRVLEARMRSVQPSSSLETQAAALALQARYPEAAVRHAVRALDLEPANVAARALLGEGLFQMGRPAEALEEWERISGVFPDKPWLNERIEAARRDQRK